MGTSRMRGRSGVLALAVLLAAVLLAMPPMDPAHAGSSGGREKPALSFSPNVLVDDGTGNAWSPSIAVDGGSKLHLAWSDDRGGFRKIYYSNSTDAGTTWAPDRLIDGAPATTNAYDPAITVDATGGTYNGSVYVAWREVTGGDADIYLRRSPDRGASWLPRVRVDGAPVGVPSTAPAIAVSSTGIVFVVYADTRNNTRLQVFVRRSFDGAATWSGEFQLSQTDANNALPTIAARGPRVYVAWRELDMNLLFVTLWASHTSDMGGSWTSTVVDTGPSPTDRRSPQVFAAPDGTVHLIWIGADSSGVDSIRASRSTDNGTSWSPPQRVDDAILGPLTYWTPRLGSAGGDLYAVWADERNGDADIFYTTSSDNGVTWGDRQAGTDARVDDTDANGNSLDDATNQTSPAVATDGFGVYVAWSDSRAGGSPSKYDLYFSRFLLQRVLITEFSDGPQGAEAVELAAYGASPISLSGYRLQIDATSWDLTPLGSLAPGQHRVVGDPGWADLVVDITVPDEGGTIALIDSGGGIVDYVPYGQRGSVPDPIAGESVSRHWSGTKYTDDWVRTPAPTWRGLNSAPGANRLPPVVLNEILFNPATPSDAFIELFYAGIPTLDLSGYTIAGDAAVPIPSGTVSAGDPYFVLKAADAPALFNSFTLSGDNVYLYDGTGTLLDMAGWSSPHSVGGSMARVPEGLGGHAGFDDGTSAVNGWRFDRAPTVPLVVLRQDQQAYGDLGESVVFRLTAAHKETAPDYIDLSAARGPSGWNVALTDIATGAPLQDHDGDSVPDTDRISPGTVFEFNVRVDIPSAPPVANNETVVVTASASLTPLARATATLQVGTYPRIEPSGSVDRNPIYVLGTPPPLPIETNLTLSINGRGSARIRRAPQDTVLLLDRSGSLGDAFCPGCFPLLKDAAKSYVDNLTIPDTGTVIYFTDAPIYKGPLTTNYALVKSWIDSETTPGGGTQIGEAIQAANNEIAARGIPFHFWAIILLTDGQDNPGGLDPLNEARASAALGIRVFTIGLGPSADETLLRNIAGLTGGEYLHADSASDLYGIYERIGTLVDSLAGYDSDLTDDVPMVSVTLPPYIVLPSAPMVDPATGSPRPADFRATTPQGTVLQWNVSALRVNDTWSVRFPVRSSRIGIVDALSVPASRAVYQRWDGTQVTVPFPRVPVTVLQASQPTVRYTITRSPAAGLVWVDNGWFGVPAAFDWYPGTLHTLQALSTDPFGPDSRYLLRAWDDGGAVQHDFTVGTADATITAVYTVQHRPTLRFMGTSAVHDVGLRFVQAGVASTARCSGTWADWVDEGTRLEADAFAAGSGADERWATEEDFSAPPWAAVAAPFSRTVLYFHQYALRLVASGLTPAWPATLSATAFGRAGTTPVVTAWTQWIDEATDASIVPSISVSVVERYATSDGTRWTGDRAQSATVRYYHQWLWRLTILGLPDVGLVDVSRTEFGAPSRDPATAPWAEWLDDGGPLTVDDRYNVGPRERYRTEDAAAWTVDRAADVTLGYLHEVRPSVTLVGTDPGHTVGLTMRVHGSDRPVRGLSGRWMDWVEVGGILVFDSQTSGLVPLKTSDPTSFTVESPFDATIAYTTPLDVNFKPFFSAVFVAILAGIGAVVAYRRPVAWKGSRRPTESGPAAIVNRVKRDRTKTGLAIVLPVASVEGAIGIVSFFTGLLRIPEGGSWLSLGLVINSGILLGGIVGQILARHRGYLARPDLERAARMAALRAPPPPPDQDD